MDVVLINSSHNGINHLTVDSQMKRVTDMLPLGVCYLATELEMEGFEVRVLDMVVLDENEFKEALKELVEDPPGCIGISSSTLSYVSAMEAATFFKDKLGPDYPVFMGGYHVTFEYEETLKSNMVDVVIRGEGEEVIGRVVDILRNHKSKSFLCDIPGLSFLKDGEVYSTSPDILRVKDLDRLPIPKRNYFKSELYRNKGTIISSRGCVAKCQFCAAGAFGAIRTRSAVNVADEIEILYNNGIKNIYFVDNTFASNRKRAIQIFRILEQKGIKINCFIEARVTEVDEEYIDLLKSFGVTSIQFGVETGNAEVMKSIHKNITLERVEKTVELCCQKGIGVACSFVIGHPADTEETVRDTIAFATRLKRMGAEPAFSIMTPYPGTEAYRKREELGVEIQDWNFAHWDLNRAVARTKNLSVRKMNKLHSEAMLTLNAI
ncbi:MAG: B12-binding domain-containing radical SAM protein [Lachnospiraceae bacterium]|nr:B12-binding domain-containing radical SAM protein [Lachnospiraceae bacterium]